MNPKSLKPTSDVINNVVQKIDELMIEKELYGLSDEEILEMMKTATKKAKTKN